MDAPTEPGNETSSSFESAHQPRHRFYASSEDSAKLRRAGENENTTVSISLIGKILLKCFPNAKFVQERKNFIFKKFHILLSRLFYNLGVTIADNVLYFILVPIVISFIFATAFLNIEMNNDPEFLFTPRHGRSLKERATVYQYFPVNFEDNFKPDRLIREAKFVHLALTLKDGGNLINQTLWEEIRALDHFAKTFEFKDEEGNAYTYRDICAKSRGKCVENSFLDLTDRIHEVTTQNYHLPYPVMFNSDTFDQYIFPTFLAGIKLYPENTIKSAEAMLLTYWCNAENEELMRLGSLYEHQFLAHYQSGLKTPSLDIAIRYSTDYEEELERNTQSVVPYFSGTILVMVVFCLASLTTGDCVRSKTFLGIGSILSSTLACAAAFGFLLYCGVPFIGVNMAAPFLMLGIGLDDTFVMVSAWHSTRFQDSVRERMGNAYAEAAVSITITSVTSIISFLVGTLTDFLSVQVFCLYLAMSVLVTYVWHITLFGGLLALSGHAEKRQLHSLTFKKVSTVSQSKEKPLVYRSCCAGGISVDDPDNPEDNRPHSLMVFFRDYVAEVLYLPAVKVLAGVLFVVYISIAVYGWTVIGVGMEINKIVRYDSFTRPFDAFEKKYLRNFAYRPMIVFTGNITYSDPATEKNILGLIEKIENHPNVGDPFYSECWLRKWSEFMDKNGRYLGLNNSDEKAFIYNLQEYFLAGESNNFRLDVKFNDDNSSIVASRCLVQAVNVLDGINDKRLMEDLRQYADESALNVTIFYFHLVYFDHLTLIKSTCLLAASCAAVIMVVIAFIFIPNPMCSLWVGLSVASIETGVIGYMGLWGVNFDVMSMIQLIMCIGFSVDFTAHICYAFLASQADTPKERMRDSLYLLGLPIMQGALSTLLGVLILMLVPSYIFVTFFKTVFMVIFFGTLHGIFLVPVFLSVVGNESSETLRSKKAALGKHVGMRNLNPVVPSSDSD